MKWEHYLKQRPRNSGYEDGGRWAKRRRFSPNTRRQASRHGALGSYSPPPLPVGGLISRTPAVNARRRRKHGAGVRDSLAAESTNARSGGRRASAWAG